MSSTANLYPAPGAAPLISQPTSNVQASGATSETRASASLAPHSVATSTAALQTVPAAVAKTSKLVAFEGLLKKAGHIAGVVLTDIVKYVIPVASVVALADPAAAPAVEAFAASVKLVQTAVISVQQKWSDSGSQANAQKLADVLEIVEQPVVTMFAQAGVQVDTGYVTNLVNGVVAILNAQPGVVLPSAA